MDYIQIAQNVINGHRLSKSEAMKLVAAPEDDFLLLMHAAFLVRKHFFGKEVRVHVLQNAKSGVCPEDCKFCSQSLRYNKESDVPKYKMKSAEELIEGARAAVDMGAVTYCMVTSTRGPNLNEIFQVTEAARKIKEEFPQLKLCASLGLLKEGQAEALAESGIDRYNHNLEASRRFFPEIATTHQVDDRIETVRKAKKAGLEACCGGIVGLGETHEDWVDLVLMLRELEVDAVPLNFLNPRPNTPLEHIERKTPRECLKALALFRIVYPTAELRVAGGREVILRSLGPMSLWAANSMFTNGYLTTPGAKPSDDYQMIVDAGFYPVTLELPANDHHHAHHECIETYGEEEHHHECGGGSCHAKQVSEV